MPLLPQWAQGHSAAAPGLWGTGQFMAREGPRAPALHPSIPIRSALAPTTFPEPHAPVSRVLTLEQIV